MRTEKPVLSPPLEVLVASRVEGLEHNLGGTDGACQQAVGWVLQVLGDLQPQPPSLPDLPPPEAEMAPSSRAHLGEMPLAPEGVGF